ncbi:MAG: 16S rRNA (guanine(527)-N(7))-methyltransferase RsmG [Congregibacter sp.]
MLEAKLRNGLAGLNISLNDHQQQQLLDFLALLERWNRRINLTAVRKPSDMVTRHLLDSLSLMPYLQGARYIDVGTGGGLPGLPLAIANPSKHFTLLDSNGKKTRFLIHVKTQLKLDNVDVVQARVETYEADPLFDAVLSRAFTSLDAMIDQCEHLISECGELLAMKAQQSQAELDALKKRVKDLAVIPLSVPYLEEKRCLVRLRL